MTPNDVIAKALATSHALLKRYTADLTPAEYLHRPSPTANCAAWTIGHLVLSERRCLATFGVADLPPLPDGFEKVFSRDEGCPQASTFGDVSVLMFSNTGELALFMATHTSMHAGQITMIRRSLGRPPLV